MIYSFILMLMMMFMVLLVIVVFAGLCKLLLVASETEFKNETVNEFKKLMFGQE